MLDTDRVCQELGCEGIGYLLSSRRAVTVEQLHVIGFNVICYCAALARSGHYKIERMSKVKMQGISR